MAEIRMYSGGGGGGGNLQIWNGNNLDYNAYPVTDLVGTFSSLFLYGGTSCGATFYPSGSNNIEYGSLVLGIDAGRYANPIFFVDNTCLGGNAGQNITGSQQVAVGKNALKSALGQFGGYNVAMGWRSMEFASGNAQNNTALGTYASLLNTTGSYNTAVGSNAIRGNQVGEYNTAVGHNSMQYIGNTGSPTSYNTAVGHLSLGVSTNPLGSYNSALGYATDHAGFSNCVLLGAQATATANNQIVFGSASYNVGAVTSHTGSSTKKWSVIINGTPYEILIA